MDSNKLTEEAATWLVRLEDDLTPECRIAFTAWLKQSALNMEEFLFLTAAYKELDALDAERKIDIEALIRATASEQAPNIVALRKPSLFTGARSKHRWRSLAIAASVAAVALIGWLAAATLWPDHYSTAIGEQRAVKLADGSVIQLNTRSQVEVKYSRTAREIRLLEGEALFAVEHDPTRPFRVLTDTAVIQALGTQFNVYRRTGATTVSVVQGLVRTTPAATAELTASTSAAQVLAVGEEAKIASNGRIYKQVAAEINRSIAWRQRKLDFRGSSLVEVAQEFNRYNRIQIRVEGVQASSKKLNGVFNADEPQSLLEFLRADEELMFERKSGEIVIQAREVAPHPSPLP